MNQNAFKDEDKKKLVELLNMVATSAKLELKVDEIIKFYGLLAHIQTVVLPKIDANVLEVVKVVEEKEQVKENKKTNTSKSK